MQELTELEIKVTNFLMKFGILPDRSNFKYTRELIDLIKNHDPEQFAINGVVGRSEQLHECSQRKGKECIKPSSCSAFGCNKPM